MKARQGKAKEMRGEETNSQFIIYIYIYSIQIRNLRIHLFYQVFNISRRNNFHMM